MESVDPVGVWSFSASPAAALMAAFTFMSNPGQDGLFETTPHQASPEGRRGSCNSGLP